MTNKTLKDYLLLINKPAFITSHDCISIIKKKLNVNKIGHTGTLDPLATGLMVILINDATKISDFILATDKTYIATMKLFTKTDSGDITGNIIEKTDSIEISIDKINKTFKKYNGIKYEQEVPLFSAVKKNGKKLYQYAREKEPIALPRREVEIKKINLISFSNNSIEFKVTCSKGTYIRSLINDLAKSMNTIATLSLLQRTAQSGFDIKNSLKIQEINIENLGNNIISIKNYLQRILPVIKISEEKELKKVKNGQSITLAFINHAALVLLIDIEEKPLAIYQHITNNNYKCKRGFI